MKKNSLDNLSNNEKVAYLVGYSDCMETASNFFPDPEKEIIHCLSIEMLFILREKLQLNFVSPEFSNLLYELKKEVQEIMVVDALQKMKDISNEF